MTTTFKTNPYYLQDLVNRHQKRERLPSTAALHAAGPAIRAWWSAAYMAADPAVLDRFREEAVASLPVLAPNVGAVNPDLVFDVLGLQRVRLRVDQRVPEWTPRVFGLGGA